MAIRGGGLSVSPQKTQNKTKIEINKRQKISKKKNVAIRGGCLSVSPQKTQKTQNLKFTKDAE